MKNKPYLPTGVIIIIVVFWIGIAVNVYRYFEWKRNMVGGTPEMLFIYVGVLLVCALGLMLRLEIGRKLALALTGFLILLNVYSLTNGDFTAIVRGMFELIILTYLLRPSVAEVFGGTWPVLPEQQKSSD